MTSYARHHAAPRPRILQPSRLESLKEWSAKPFSPLSEVVFPAVAGALAFALLAIIGLS